MRKLVAILALLLIGPSLQARQELVSTKDLINKMYHTYKDIWYHTITFIQQTEFFQNGTKQREETWYEAMDLKSGALIIKFNSMNSGNGMIFRNDSLLSYADDRLKAKSPKVHELIVLGFSVYTSSPESTLAKLKTAGFDTEHFGKEIFDSRLHYVAGDPEKAQFWIDAQTLLFTKLKKVLPNGRVSEIEFKGYQKLGEGWIETEVIFSMNRVVIMREVYHDIKSPKSLPATFYSQSMFSHIIW